MSRYCWKCWLHTFDLIVVLSYILSLEFMLFWQDNHKYFLFQTWNCQIFWMKDILLYVMYTIDIDSEYLISFTMPMFVKLFTRSFSFPPNSCHQRFLEMLRRDSTQLTNFLFLFYWSNRSSMIGFQVYLFYPQSVFDLFVHTRNIFWPLTTF